jgi:chemotaxis protein CheZ
VNPGPAPEAPQDREARVDALRALLTLHEHGETAAFDEAYARFAAADEASLKNRVARLTRQLHRAMSEMPLDHRLARLAGDEIPDARARLAHVVALTENAAHRTLDLVDEARAVPVALESSAAALADGALAEGLRAQAQRLRQTLSELALAQEYQDLAGQMIKRVITLVIQVENALMELLDGVGRPAVEAVPAASPAASGSELRGPALPSEQAVSQSDADDVLASLGF